MGAHERGGAAKREMKGSKNTPWICAKMGDRPTYGKFQLFFLV